METRALGATGLEVSTLGFGCGSVGGLLVRGNYQEMVRAVAHAIEEGVTYFDTARSYGDGRSEANLGRVLKELGADVVVGSKVGLSAEEMEGIEEAVVGSVEGSLKRLGRERIDLIQLHNPVTRQRAPGSRSVTIDDIERVLATFDILHQQGKVRFWGINGLGDTEVLHQAVANGHFHTIQSCYNLLNPSAGMQAPPGFPFQDYGQLIDRAASANMGVIAIRVLAGGALSGAMTRHPNAAKDVAPIATGRDYGDDVARAAAFHILIDGGYANSMVEAAIRFAIGKAELSTVLVGISNLEQLEQAVDYVNRGPLPAAAMEQIEQVWATSSSK